MNQIGRISPQGTIREFVPPNCCFPTGIAAGADGRMWFTLEIGDMIGRVEIPSGAMTMFPIASIQVLPWDITAGPDGAMWFTELAGRAIGRISLDGAIVEHPIPGPFSGIAGITTGPDGDLWFTENDTHHVGSIDVAGTLQPPLLDTGMRPLSITLGPDGNLWFTEADASAIGRVDVAMPGVVHVLSMDAGFAPRLRRAPLGSAVQWTFLGPNQHSVADVSGLFLYDSGPHTSGSSFVLACDFAGTFVYGDGVGNAALSAIQVPMRVPESSVLGQPVPVTWALVPPLAGIVFDIQVKTPGTIAFVDWTSSADMDGAYAALATGPHTFRARMRNPLSGRVTLWSPPAVVLVTNRAIRRP